jgi:thioredoxin-like negative regulator of GroEL
VADTLGWILVEEGNTARGIDLLQKATAGAPKAQSIRFHLVQAWLKTGDKRKAREELERLLSSDAKFAEQDQAIALLKELRK